MLWLLLLLVIALIFIYVLIVRPVLKNAPALSPAFAAEASFMDKLRVKLVGWKTKIASRCVVLSGVLVALYDQFLPYVSTQDWTPLTEKLPGWVLPVGLVGVGWLFSYLRKVTENPPLVITDRTDDGTVHVVDMVKAPGTPVAESVMGLQR